ncbi:MAG: beta-galactosidase [Propionibacteriaceae bacterium]|jgi:beta-galactosidase|nr:beta-galactosidase [Propionibacteriaceae bacterium]
MAIVAWPTYIDTPVLAYGADYNPDQWPREVWDEDMALMQQAGVNMVSLGIFSWARVQPTPTTWDFDWLDEVMDLCASHGIAVDLATMTASAPAWLTTAHPDSTLVTAEGVRLAHGARQTWCPSSPVYREASLTLLEKLATRYATHPALALWHVSNELGCHNAICYCPTSEAAFRAWLQAKYTSLDRLNEAWGTAFWAQHYGTWEEILSPRAMASFTNPTHVLDYRRFSADCLRGQLRAEREVLRAITPNVPVTTNLMVFGDAWRNLDYGSWIDDVDVVANDHYLMSSDPRRHIGLSMAADSSRGLAKGEPWMLMEHSTSAVNWQPINRAKVPGEMRRNSLTHVARGSDCVMYFQWRASASGAEKFHSGMVPHAGADSDLFRAVCDLGADLGKLSEVVGSKVVCEAALVVDRDSWVGCDGETVPSHGLDYAREVRRWYEAAWDAHLTLDVVDSSADFGKYKVVILPHWYMMSQADVDRLTKFVEAGGRVVTTFFSGIADRDEHIVLGGYPGALRDLLGVRVQEFRPLLEGESVALEWGASGGADSVAPTGSIWCERVDVSDARPLLRYVHAPADLPGSPAVTEAKRGEGRAYYVSTCLDPETLTHFVGTVADKAGCTRPDLPRDVESVIRRTGDAEWVFLLNHTDEAVGVATEGSDVLDQEAGPVVQIPAGGVRVVRRDRKS